MGNPLTNDRRTEVWIRDRGKCRRCGTRDGVDVHHRIPRQMGGTTWKHQHDLKILILLCRSCHTWIETNRAEAYEQGWLLHTEEWRAKIERGETPPVPEALYEEVEIPPWGSYHQLRLPFPSTTAKPGPDD